MMLRHEQKVCMAEASFGVMMVLTFNNHELSPHNFTSFLNNRLQALKGFSYPQKKPLKVHLDG
jgi:hypothetical protein